MRKLKEKELLKRLENWREEKYSTFYSRWKDGDERAYKRIVELIKIFFAKEISSGPIEKDISRPVLIQWLQGINQAATAMNDDYVMKATTQLIEMVREPGNMEEWIKEKSRLLSDVIKVFVLEAAGEIKTNSDSIKVAEDFIRIFIKEIHGIDPTWLPTAENINALPEPVRNYIAGLETNADPPSMVADNIIMKDTIKTLEKMFEEKPEFTEEWIEEKAERFMLQCPGIMAWHSESVKKFTKDFIRLFVEEIK